MMGLRESFVLQNCINRLEMIWKFVDCSVFPHAAGNQKLLMSPGQWYPLGSVVYLWLPGDLVVLKSLGFSNFGTPWIWGQIFLSRGWAEGPTHPQMQHCTASSIWHFSLGPPLRAEPVNFCSSGILKGLMKCQPPCFAAGHPSMPRQCPDESGRPSWLLHAEGFWGLSTTVVLSQSCLCSLMSRTSGPRFLIC